MTMTRTPTASQRVFDADMARFDKMFTEADALRVEADGFAWIDQTKVSASAISTYQGLIQYGYANGLI